MNNEIKNKKYVTYDYIVNELADNMSESIEKMKGIILSQTKLSEYLNESKDKELFTDFINSLKQANEQYNEQIRVLTHRLACINEVKEMMTSDVEERLVSLLLEALGVANKEAKSIKEREDNHETIKTIETFSC